MNIKRIFRFLRNIKRAYNIYNHRIYIDKRLEEIRKEFYKFDFDDGLTGNGILGDPLRDIGTAIRLIKHYKMDLHVGTCYGDCRAVITKENWINPISGPLEGRFTTNENIKEVDSIYGVGPSVNEAVCKCLIFAKIARVI